MFDKIKRNWENYISVIHYNIFIKKQIKNLNKDIKKNIEKSKKLKKYKEEIEKIQQDYICTIESIQHSKDDKTIVLVGKELKHSSISKFLEKIFKFDGYLLYGNKGNDFKIIKIKNLDIIYNIAKQKETYNIIKSIGTHKGKPLFMVKFPYAVTLEIREDATAFRLLEKAKIKTHALYYDVKSYYQYITYATNRNILKQGDEEGIFSFIRKNFLFIIILIVIIIIISTPQGQEFIQELFNGGKK